MPLQSCEKTYGAIAYRFVWVDKENEKRKEVEMATCEKCKRKIPDGERFCVACKEKNTHKRRFWVKVGAGIATVVATGFKILVAIGLGASDAGKTHTILRGNGGSKV